MERPNFEQAICYAHLGDVNGARRILEQLKALAATTYVDKAQLAGIYAALGESDNAFAALEQAAQDRSAYVATPLSIRG